MVQTRERPTERNGIKAAASRPAAPDGPGSGSNAKSARRRGGKGENSIQPVARQHAREGGRTSASNGAAASATAAAAAARSEPAAQGAAAPDGSAGPGAIPEHVRRRFVQVGRKYYFPDGARAFTDRGRRLTTPSENTQVVRSLVAIAQARGWNEIAVRGTERFRNEAWFAARQAGLAVQGYRPSEFEQAHLVRTLAAERAGAAAGESAADARPQSAVPSPEPRRGALAGTLVDHGPAPYHHNPREPMSYFVKLETAGGQRVIWGVDLQRAFKQSLTQPKIGDAVGLRAVRQEPVTVKTAQRDEQGELTGQEDLQTHRNRWIVEKGDFFSSRAAAAQTLRDTRVDPKQAVKAHPELAGTYLQMQAAKLAARRFRDPQDQQRFVTQVRSALADSIARGEPLAPMRLRERSGARTESRSRSAREPPQARG